MSALDAPPKGDKIDCHLLLYSSRLAVIDALAAKYGISRAAVVEAWAEDYQNGLLQGANFSDQPGRRPRKKGTSV